MEKYKYSDEEFRFMENSGVPFGIYQVIDEQIYTIVLTKGFLDFFGYADMPKEEVYQMLDNDFFIDVHPDDREIVKGIVDTFNHTHQDYNAVYRIKIKERNMKSIVSAKKKKERQYGVIWGAPNSSVAKREYAPGQHGQRRKKPTDYGEQLSAKQKLKTYYGNVSEKQFHILLQDLLIQHRQVQFQ